jgi:rod shape-determining protein MreC
MAFGVANSSLPGRGPTPGLRFALYAILAITLMFLDKRGGWMEQVRFAMDAATYPLQLAVSSPSAAWSWMRESVRTRDSLRAENDELRTKVRNLELRTMRYEALALENAELRGLRSAIPPVAEKWLVAEIVSERPRVLINRGTNNGVHKAQAVLSDQGIIGQTTHVGPWSAEVILLTDVEHAIPVQIERTGVRTIAVGTGNEGELALPYLPGNADVTSGDLLITSGLGGVFPQGFPVARITSVQRDAVQPLAQVRAEPFGRITRDREVMLVWFREAHPAAPVRDASKDLAAGDPNVKPQATPPKPKPEAPAAGTAAQDGSAAPASGTARPGTNAPKPMAGPRQTVPAPAPSAAPQTAPAPAAATPTPAEDRE